jgi:hypothetical protein
MVLRPMWVYVDEDIKILYIVYAFFICYYFQVYMQRNKMRFAFSKHCTPPNIYKTHTHKKHQKREKRGDIY